jgi:hypothetical protein
MRTRWAGCLAVTLGYLIAANASAEEPTPVLADEPAACTDRWFGRAEYLAWWIKDANLPALAPLGVPALASGETMSSETHSGGRFTLGYWFTAQHDFAVQGDYLFLGRQERSAGPGITLSDRLQGGEVDLRSIGWSSPCYQIDLVGGFRFLAFDEDLDITPAPSPLPLSPAGERGRGEGAGSFGARNRFYGGDLGVAGGWHSGKYVLDVRGTVALGVMEETANLGGPLVVTERLGSHSHSDFAAVPEVRVAIGRQLTTHLSGYVGYTFLYASSAVRAGDTIEPGTAPVPPGTHPAFTFHQGDFWAQGIDVGLELRY